MGFFKNLFYKVSDILTNRKPIDEELFEDLLAKQWYGDERSFEDDGTVITGEYISYVIGNNGKHEVVTTIEFDRETGFITISTESPYAP